LGPWNLNGKSLQIKKCNIANPILICCMQTNMKTDLKRGTNLKFKDRIFLKTGTYFRSALAI
jgi:hypothetical protein